ncbi:MAG: hypothetical protein AAF363_12315 [Bacteroidota bacterium]
MKKIVSLKVLEPFKLKCIFNNKEERLLNLKDILNQSDKYAQKVFVKEILKDVKIGSHGEIYWDGIAQIKSLSGEMMPCEYDISPDLAYLKSSPV